MTLGVQSVGAGVALFLTGGVPVTGFPHTFGDTFGFGRVFSVPVPVAIAIVAIIAVAVFLYGTRFGRHLYAVGGNVKAAKLSGINTTATLLIAYGASALLASVVGLLLTARVESGRRTSVEPLRSSRSPPASSAGCRCTAALVGLRASCLARSSSCLFRTVWI